MIRFASLALMAVLAVPAASRADTTVLPAPIAAGALHDGTLDMVAFYVPAGDAVEVTAMFAARSNPTTPARIRMVLAEGESTAFGIPGHPGSIFRFARTGNAVTIDVSAPGTITLAAR